MKLFTDNFEPIEVTLKDVDGNTHELKSVFMSADDIKQIEVLSKDKKILEMDKSYKILNRMFGKEESFFSKFSVALLVQVTKYVIDETKKNSITAGG